MGMQLQHFAGKLLSMRRLENDNLLQVSPFFYVVLALLLLLFPLQWLLAAILAAAVHELSHIGMIRLCKKKILSIRIHINGAIIETEPMSGAKEMICALAGPVGGLLLVFLVRWFPRVAICGVIHSLYNLLPIYPLDGGRVLYCGLEILFTRTHARRICEGIGVALLIGILAIGCYGTFVLRLGVLPLIAALVLWQKNGMIKIPCKQRQPSVQ